MGKTQHKPAPVSRRTSKRGIAGPQAGHQKHGSDKQLQSIVDHLPAFVFRRVLKPNGTVRYPYISPGLRKWCRVSPDDKGQAEVLLHEYFFREDRQLWLNAMALSGKKLAPVEIDVRLDGEKYPDMWLRTVSYPRKLANGDVLWDGIALDVTAAKSSEQHNAYHDVLTGLPSRTVFVKQLSFVLGQVKRLKTRSSVIALELATLAKIAESVGLKGGNASICETAERLQIAAQDGETVACTGGGNFLMLLVGNEKADDFSARLHAISSQFEAYFEWEGQDFPLDVVMGIAVAPDDGDEVETLIRKATTALNQAKDNPARAFRFYDAQMTERALLRSSIESELHRAIEKREFVLYYQALYHTQTLDVVGAEALIRWRHPERGLIPPGQFIPIAEETGLIIPLGEFALRQACTQAREWQSREVTDVPVSVNLSGWQLLQEDLGDRIRDILSETELAPERLKLELTESTILHDAETTTRTMTQLADLGVRFSVDDFGIEHSALSHLSRLPIETLKIDYSFICRMASDRVHAALVQAIIVMTHAMTMNAVAEGVETQQQLTYLQAYGCDAAQGFLFSKPMPAKKFEALLKRSP